MSCAFSPSKSRRIDRVEFALPAHAIIHCWEGYSGAFVPVLFFGECLLHAGNRRIDCCCTQSMSFRFNLSKALRQLQRAGVKNPDIAKFGEATFQVLTMFRSHFGFDVAHRLTRNLTLQS